MCRSEILYSGAVLRSMFLSSLRLCPLQICMGAAVSLHTALQWFRLASGHWLGERTAARLSHAALALTLLLFALLSLSRSTALVKYYGAPMHIYSYLPEVIPCELLLAREGWTNISVPTRSDISAMPVSRNKSFEVCLTDACCQSALVICWNSLVFWQANRVSRFYTL